MDILGFKMDILSTQIAKMDDNHVTKWTIDLYKKIQVQINTKITRICYNKVAKWTI